MTPDSQDHRLDPLFDFLDKHRDGEVDIEIGMRDPNDDGYEYHPASVTLPVRGYTLGQDEKSGEGILTIWLSEDQRSRLYIDRARVTAVKVGPDIVRIEFHDTMYVTISA